MLKYLSIAAECVVAEYKLTKTLTPASRTNLSKIIIEKLLAADKDRRSPDFKMVTAPKLTFFFVF